jgi:rhamnosyltransferase
MNDGPLVSVVVRTKDEAASIGRTLDLLAGQTVADRSEVIVVDSGSRDATVAIARDAGVRVIEMPASEFTYGRSLNIGAAAASAPIVIALSAHAFPPDERWLDRMLAAFADPSVACACGFDGDPTGRRLAGPRVQDAEDAMRYPYWGYSNVSGGFRADLWRQRPFREDMPGVEDKEWSWYWLQRGYVCVVDPALGVEHDHTDESVRERYRRWHREWLGIGMFVEIPPYRARDVVREWLTDTGGRRSKWRALLSPRRVAELVGTYRGRRAAAGTAPPPDSPRLVPRSHADVRVPALRD